MIKIQKWLDIGNGWTAQVNLNYDNDTKEVLMEEVVCSHKDINYESLSKTKPSVEGSSNYALHDSDGSKPKGCKHHPDTDMTCCDCLKEASSKSYPECNGEGTIQKGIYDRHKVCSRCKGTGKTS